jgi:hypothetical protein
MIRRLKPLKPGRTEAQVLSAVYDALRIHGVEPIRHNVGKAVNPSGRLVMFVRPGEADIVTMLPAGWGDASGKALHIEVKREGFNPRRLGRGAAREHFEQQLQRLNEINRNGGYAAWVTSADQVVHILRRVREGWRIELDEQGYPFLVTKES